MKQRTSDGLRTIEVESLDGGEAYQIVVSIHPDGCKGTPAQSAHVFRVYDNRLLHSPQDVVNMPGNSETAMRVYKALCERRESLGLLNWETSSLAIEIYHDGGTYDDRLRLYGDVTSAGLTVTPSAMKSFAVRHGYLRDKSLYFLELVDWVELTGWFESQREEYTEHDPDLIGL